MSSRLHLTGDLEKYVKNALELSKSDNIDDLKNLLQLCSVKEYDPSLLSTILPLKPKLMNDIMNDVSLNNQTLLAEHISQDRAPVDDDCIIIDEITTDIQFNSEILDSTILQNDDINWENLFENDK